MSLVQNRLGTTFAAAKAGNAGKDVKPEPQISVRDLVGRRVRLGAVEVGTVTGVLASRTLAYVLGLEVCAGAGPSRFVPWVALRIDEDSLRLVSVYSLLSASDLALYADNGRRLGAEDEALVVRSDGVLLRGGAAVADTGRASASRRSTSPVHVPAKRSIP
jgi:hypothetical protein